MSPFALSHGRRLKRVFNVACDFVRCTFFVGLIFSKNKKDAEHTHIFPPFVYSLFRPTLVESSFPFFYSICLSLYSLCCIYYSVRKESRKESTKKMNKLVVEQQGRGSSWRKNYASTKQPRVEPNHTQSLDTTCVTIS